LRLDGRQFDIRVRTGGPGNSIVQWEGPIAVRRYPDFELELQYASSHNGDSYTLRGNSQLYIDNSDPPYCFMYSEQTLITQRYIQHFYFYLAIYLKLHRNNALVANARKHAGMAADAATASSVIGAISTGASLIPGVGSIVGIVGFLAGETSSAISQRNYERALSDMQRALDGARADIDRYVYLHDLWRENLPSISRPDGSFYEEVACPPNHVRVTTGQPRVSPSGREHFPIRPQPVTTPGPGNYRRGHQGPFTGPSSGRDRPARPRGPLDLPEDTRHPPYWPGPGGHDYPPQWPVPDGHHLPPHWPIPGGHPHLPPYGHDDKLINPGRFLTDPALWHPLPENLWPGGTHKWGMTDILWD